MYLSSLIQPQTHLQMPKRFKLRLSLSNFQLCRSTKTYLPTTYPKPLDVSFPTGPIPPPTSPSHPPRNGAPPIKTLKSFLSFGSDFSSREEEPGSEKNKMIKTLKSFSSFRSDFTFGSFGSCEDEDRENLFSGFDDSSCDFGDPMKGAEGVVVVKRSSEPYEDFKRSMLEMILQKQTFEVDGLERLLQCFLSLNSPEYHATIVNAFTEIWESMFCDTKAS